MARAERRDVVEVFRGSPARGDSAAVIDDDKTSSAAALMVGGSA